MRDSQKEGIEMKRLDKLVKEIISFRDERDWGQFHNAKDLAVSLSIEASELLECFQWKNTQEVDEIVKSSDKESIEDEIADVAMYLLLLSHELNIDIEKAIANKIIKNGLKYPVSKAKGSSKKYTKL